MCYDHFMKYILGRTKHDDGTLSERNTISWSAYDLWRKNKEGYRKRYYENEKSFETTETIFGKGIAETLEKESKNAEYRIEVQMDGFKVQGYLDLFKPEKIGFTEFKTGHANKEGKPPWDRVKVARHGQLVFYSMLLREKFGKVDPVCHLIWLETAFKNKMMEFAGHTLQAPTKELYLTGKVKKFRRVIRKWEREKLKRELLKTVKEIHEDYKRYKKVHE